MVDFRSSTLPTLTEEIARSAIQNFFRETPFVFFGTGMSCALDTRFGMGALKEALEQNVVPDSRPQQMQWTKVIESLRDCKDLETALDGVTDSSLLRKVTYATGQFVSSIDREFALQIAERKTTWPATRLFQRLVDRPSEGDRILHVLTPNYDTLFEHACDAFDILYTTGFFGGLARRINWKAVDLSLRSAQKTVHGKRVKVNYKRRNHVRLYKVHGSLNFFFHRNALVENNAWMWNPPDFANRVIITPGLSKYKTLQDYRQELLHRADEAINKANQFLFLGYGFNDSHLQSYITQKLITQACKGLIVTKDSNPNIESLLDQAPNLWLVCNAQDAEVDGTRIYNKQYAGWLDLPKQNLWDIRYFTTEIFGG